MTLTLKQRASIYESLSPILGEENAEAMLAELPGREGDELVTKDFLRAELNEGLSSLRAEVDEGLSSLRAEIADLRIGMHALITSQTKWFAATNAALLGLVVAVLLALR